MNKNPLLLFGVIVFGFTFNQGHQYSYLIKYLIMVMLFFPFLSASFPKDKRVYLHVLSIFIAMVVISAVSYGLFVSWEPTVATVAFLVAVTPTATAAPVVIDFIKKDVDYVISAVVITNCLVALLLPFFLPKMMPIESELSSRNILISTLAVVLIPLFLAQILKNTSDKFTRALLSKKEVSFYIWLLVLYLATSKASASLFNSEISYWAVCEIAIVSLVICIVNFVVGRLIGGRGHAIEASQSLGQKNTMLMAWVALEYISPFAVLGPVFYLIYQNIYNSFLLAKRHQN